MRPDSFRSQLIREAALFAEVMHHTQKRKYTGEPYFNHLVEVTVTLTWAGCDEEVIAAGFLHDVVEDQGVLFTSLSTRFGSGVSTLVGEVTDVSRPEDGNRAFRKKLDREHLARASDRGKTIKLADSLSNTKSIVERDPTFAKIYLKEKRELLPYLRGGHPVLFDLLSQTLSKNTDV